MYRHAPPVQKGAHRQQLAHCHLGYQEGEGLDQAQGDQEAQAEKGSANDDAKALHQDGQDQRHASVQPQGQEAFFPWALEKALLWLHF